MICGRCGRNARHYTFGLGGVAGVQVPVCDPQCSSEPATVGQRALVLLVEVNAAPDAPLAVVLVALHEMYGEGLNATRAGLCVRTGLEAAAVEHAVARLRGAELVEDLAVVNGENQVVRWEVRPVVEGRIASTLKPSFSQVFDRSVEASLRESLPRAPRHVPGEDPSPHQGR